MIKLTFDNTYRQLPESFYDIVNPTPFNNPQFISFNQNAADLIDLELSEDNKELLINLLSGKEIIEGEQPLAMYYTGHQFGVYNKDIGDGRAILLGEVRNNKNQKWDLHLKGGGRTKYSRQFDGRAVLRSTIREYLASEALHALGIPTTRALCIIGGDEEVIREKPEPGAMLIRMAETHVRFGSFEAFYYSGETQNIKILADYIIKNHFPELIEKDDKYKLFLFQVADSTAKLIAKWQAFGFTHGVLNTDNMSILGITLDYGPYGFMESYNPGYTPNHSDHFGRYNYQNQPSIGFWNLQKLVQALQPIIKDDDGLEALEIYKQSYFQNYYENMYSKLGFTQIKKEDKQFVDKTLYTLANFEIDYSIFFRSLSDFKLESNTDNKFINKLSITSKELKDWFDSYKNRLNEENSIDHERKIVMDSINPKYILRNYICEQVIREAEDKKNYEEINKVKEIFSKPFEEQPEFEEYSNQSPDWAKNLVISCSS